MRKVIPSLIALFIIITIALSSCTYRNTEEILGAICDTTNTKYSSFVKGVIETRCSSQSGCHGASAGSISLVAHSDVSGATSDILNRIKSGNMPKGSSKLDDCTITRFETWVNKGAQNN